MTMRTLETKLATLSLPFSQKFRAKNPSKKTDYIRSTAVDYLRWLMLVD